MKLSEYLIAAALVFLASIALLIAFATPPIPAPYMVEVAVKVASLVAAVVCVSLLASYICNLVAAPHAAPKAPKIAEATEVQKAASRVVLKPIKIPVSGRHILYLDFAVAVFLSIILLYIIVGFPAYMLTSTAEAYARLAASALLGITVSLAVAVAYDIMRGRSLAVALPPKAARPVKPGVRPLSEDFIASVISNVRILKAWAESVSVGIRGDVLKAGLAASPFRLASKQVFYTLTAVAASIPLAVLLALLVHPALIGLAVAPLAPYLFPKLRLRSAVGDRRRAIDNELPFFTIMAAILQDAGVNLYNAMLSIVGRGIFRQIEGDALIAKRDVEFFFKSPLEALEDLGRVHPNEKMRGFLLGYTSEWRSGGDIVSYLEAKAEDFLNDMSFKWRSYAERAADMGETIISLFFVFPMLIVMSAFIMPAQAMMLMTVILTVVIPMVSTMVFGVIHSIQPKTFDALSGNAALAAGAGAAASVIAPILGMPLWLSIVAALAAASTVYGAVVLIQMREVRMAEGALPQFLRDMTEYRKMGYDVTQAFLKIAEENTYNPVFDGVLAALSRQMRLGRRMSEADVPARSWLTRMCFFLIAQVVESGGGTVRSLEILTDFINRVVRLKAEARSMMRLYQVLSLFTPVGLSMTTALMFSLIAAFASNMTPEAAAIGLSVLAELTQVPKGLMEGCFLLTIAASVSVALLTTKTIDLTGKNTVWVAVNLALAAGGIALSTQIASLLMNMLMKGAGLAP
jgi:flagellar protein FlaJ